MEKEKQNPLQSNNALDNYNNSSPSLTGDLLFQQRIDRCLVAYHSANNFSTLYCSASSLFIDLSFCLTPEEEEETQKILNRCYYLIPRCMDGSYSGIEEIFKKTHQIMVFLTKKAHEKGFILQVGPENKRSVVR